MGDPRQKNESWNHALLAVGIILLLILSIIFAWIIVCCERCRRKRKYRPGQQSRRRDPLGASGVIIRTGPSPQFNRHLLVSKPSEHLVIANKAFLSKSTPHLLDQEDEAWRFERLKTPSPTPCPSEPLIPSSRRPVIVTSAQRSQPQPRPGPSRLAGSSVPRTRSEPVLAQQDEFGFSKDVSIHDQIAAILGTFPTLDFMSLVSPTRAKPKPQIPKTSSSPSRSYSKLKEEEEIEMPESSVDDTVTVDYDMTPLSTGQFPTRPVTLSFQEESSTITTTREEIRYDFDVEKGKTSPSDDEPPLLETTL